MPTTIELTTSSPASVVALFSPASVTSDSSATAISPFFNKLPLEIRQQIYRHVFEGSVMLANSHRDVVPCESCGLFKLETDCMGTIRHRTSPFSPSFTPFSNPCSICSQASLRIQGPANYSVLLTCQAIYQETRPILASSLNIYMYCITNTAAKQVLWALEHDTFLRYAIPHIQCLHVPWELDAVVPILQDLYSLRNLKVKVWKVPTAWLGMSAEEYMSPQSDQELIRSVKRQISRGKGMMKSSESPHRRFKVQVRYSLFSNYSLFPNDKYDFKYVFEYDVDSGTILCKHIYRYDNDQHCYVDKISGDTQFASGNLCHDIEEAAQANWDENYAINKTGLGVEDQGTETAQQEYSRRDG